MEESRAKSVIDYYVLCNKLKHIIRTGWKVWNVNKTRLESVAEHVYGVQNLAIAMHSQYQYDIDIYKVIFMLAIHELEEIVIGDLTFWDTSSEDKLLRGHAAVETILHGLLNKKQINSLVLEFDERKTNEAIFAYHCDKLECDIQCKLYDEENCVNMNNQENNKFYHDKRVQEIIKIYGTTWSNVFLEYDRSKYTDDKNFIEVLEYVKNNDINLCKIEKLK